LPRKANLILWIYSEDHLEGRPFLFQILPLALPFSGWRIARSMTCLACFQAVGEHRLTSNTESAYRLADAIRRRRFLFSLVFILPLKEDSP
jgi:hypothetical protein